MCRLQCIYTSEPLQTFLIYFNYSQLQILYCFCETFSYLISSLSTYKAHQSMLSIHCDPWPKDTFIQLWFYFSVYAVPKSYATNVIKLCDPLLNTETEMSPIEFVQEEPACNILIPKLARWVIKPTTIHWKLCIQTTQLSWVPHDDVQFLYLSSHCNFIRNNSFSNIILMCCHIRDV